MNIKLISLKSFVSLSVVLGILFLTIGDRIFPSPLKEASQDSRTWLNNSLVSLFPQIDIDHGYNNQRNDQIIRQVEQKK